ncbi:DUF3732 domain-containing protein [Actinobacillus equuli subsp. haemolyticus]|uniref:DUF3732 domain-containing protein n=1 Tax=Actinobacillus equuli TaxID=718 RepID=UPI002446626E|nr:DUF3732 domain-containing protein [Actinobacillus equuli]WGE51380.1 DUF3732 domain-containing protein [Actinobacillus equuli subsp. haemolyticus]
MKTVIHEIGVVDKCGKIHKAELKEGLNIITGKSSTGKSALIEMFDYCFGGQFNVPKGVITENSEIYYLYIQIKESYFVIGRKKDNGRGFFREEETYSSDLISSGYFKEDYFLAKDNYRKQLRKLFIDIIDVDESLIAKELKGKATPTPSVRSFMSFILQHQNLIANKHALFYRFDEKEKREQVIEHTKIFLGFVDQTYFLLLQKKEALEYDFKKLQREQKVIDKYINENISSIENQLNLLYALIGVEETPIKIEDIKINSHNSKLELDKFVTDDKIIYTSEKELEYFKELLKELSANDDRRKNLSFKLASIERSLQIEKDVSVTLSSLEDFKQAEVGISVCPFCLSEKDSLPKQAENLKQAIQKLSRDLALNHSLRSHLEVERQKIQQEIGEINTKIREIRKTKEQLEKRNNNIQEIKSRYEKILMVKASLFSMLDILSQKQSGQLGGNNIDELKFALKEINNKLKNYDANKKLKESEVRINEIMSDIGQNFEFENSYHPINLNFSLNSFDLYHTNSSNEKIYLRSMGSGANWLYCHITLFLALHQYFIELESQEYKCSIPSILFLDQPTQVYFPNFQHDSATEFDEHKIANLEHKDNIDGDIQSVTNLFTRLAEYCNNLKNKYGYSPQIIVTDHADNLNLNGFEFESFVKNRWRTRGFIELND